MPLPFYEHSFAPGGRAVSCPAGADALGTRPCRAGSVSSGVGHAGRAAALGGLLCRAGGVPVQRGGQATSPFFTSIFRQISTAPIDNKN